MPALSARRSLVTGMRAFPFRDWRRLEGFPSVPGFNPVWDHQPLLMELTRAAGIETIYVTDNPVFSGARFPDVRPSRAAVGRARRRQLAGIDEELLPSFKRLTERRRARTMRLGIKALREVKRADSFFVGVDPSTRPTRSPRRRSTCGRDGRRTTASARPTGGSWSCSSPTRTSTACARPTSSMWRRWTSSSASSWTRCPTTRSCSSSATTASRSASTAISGARRRPRTGCPTRSRT